MSYYIRFVENGRLIKGEIWHAESEEALSNHILGYLENYPGEFYDVVFVEVTA